MQHTPFALLLPIHHTKFTAKKLHTSNISLRTSSHSAYWIDLLLLFNRTVLSLFDSTRMILLNRGVPYLLPLLRFQNLVIKLNEGR
jgi:Zn-dependent protease with chaperone function